MNYYRVTQLNKLTSRHLAKEQKRNPRLAPVQSYNRVASIDMLALHKSEIAHSKWKGGDNEDRLNYIRS